MKLKHEDILTPASEVSEGEMVQKYECGYCGAIRTKQVKIHKLEKGQEFKLPNEMHFKGEKAIETIAVEVYLNDGSSKVYEFQNIEQTKNFLEQYKEELESENELYKG